MLILTDNFVGYCINLPLHHLSLKLIVSRYNEHNNFAKFLLHKKCLGNLITTEKRYNMCKQKNIYPSIFKKFHRPIADFLLVYIVVIKRIKTRNEIQHNGIFNKKDCQILVEEKANLFQKSTKLDANCTNKLKIKSRFTGGQMKICYLYRLQLIKRRVQTQNKAWHNEIFTRNTKFHCNKKALDNLQNFLKLQQKFT